MLTVHTEAYLDLLRRVSATAAPTFLDADTYAGPDALTIALLSAGGALGACDGVLSGSADNGLAAIRPPGHHAMPSRAMGFCLLGNVAIAARYAQRQYGIERVLIIDYDVHHGNGTEAMFYDDPSVLYVSTHQYPFYPATGAVTDIGTGHGEGYTVNIALPAGSGDANYAKVFEQIVWPAAERFEPQLILVSLGFDAYWEDPLAGMRVTLSGYSHLAGEVIRMAQRYCGAKSCSCSRAATVSTPFAMASATWRGCYSVTRRPTRWAPRRTRGPSLTSQVWLYSFRSCTGSSLSTMT